MTATCSKKDTCSSDSDITKFKHLKQDSWATGRFKIKVQ